MLFVTSIKEERAISLAGGSGLFLSFPFLSLFYMFFAAYFEITAYTLKGMSLFPWEKWRQ